MLQGEIITYANYQKGVLAKRKSAHKESTDDTIELKSYLSLTLNFKLNIFDFYLSKLFLCSKNPHIFTSVF